MADYYLDHGVYATSIGATPTWGVPQEGDGSSKDAATSSSVATVQFTANATGGSSAISVCGVTFTATTHFTVGGSLSATLDNLVTAINGSTTTVSSSVAVGVPQLRNLVFARKTGAGNDTLEIMSRVGSLQCNNATNSNWSLTTSNWTNNGVTNFAGGTGGCWGYLLNTAAIGVSSSIAVLTYGLFGASILMMPNAAQATPTESDIIWARTKNSGGSNKTISYTSSSSYAVSRTLTWPMHMVWDTNTKWTGDGTDGVCTLDLAVNTSNNLTIRVGLAGGSGCRSVRITSKARSNFVMKFSGTTSGSSAFLLPSMSSGGNVLVLDNIKIWDAIAVANGGVRFMESGQAIGTQYHLGVEFIRPLSASTLWSFVTNTSGSVQLLISRGSTYTWNINSAANPGPIIDFGSALTSAAHYAVVFEGCTFDGWPLGNNEFDLYDALTAQPFNNGNGICLVRADGCSGIRLTSSYAGFMLQPATTFEHLMPEAHAAVVNNSKIGGSLRYENRAGIVEWDINASPAYPTLSAVIEDGVTKWSQKVIWGNSGECTIGHGFAIPPLDILYLSSASTKKITLELFMRTTHVSALNFTQMRLDVSYVNNATGKVTTETLSAVPQSSAASWTNAGSFSGYAAYKLELTTTNSIKPLTPVTVKLSIFGKPGTGQPESFYLDPEFGITTP